MHNLRWAGWCLAGLLCAASAAPQTAGTAQEKKPLPPQSAPAEKPAQEKPPDYSQEPFVIEQLHLNATFENDGTGRRETSVRVRVQTDAGVQQFGQLALGYNSANEKMDVESVRVHKADGSVVTAGPEAVQDLSAPIEREAPIYTDFRQKHITVPGLRPGEVLEYRITTHLHTPLAPGHFWLEYDFIRDAIVLDEQLIASIPQGRTLKLKTTAGHDPLIAESAGRKTYTWKSSFLKREDESEEAKKKKPKRAKPEPPAVQLSTFQSWEEVGRWYAQLAGERTAPDAAVRAKAQELLGGLTADAEKIRAAYDFVAKNFRYVSLSFGVGRYQPHAPGEVLANQYGDCKDKHTLLASLLEAAGVHAYPVLIHSQRKLDEEVPSPSQFDHVITAVELGSDLVWMDTTTEVAPYRLLGSTLRGKKALLVSSGPAGAPRLVDTPADPPFPSTQLAELEGTVSDLGKLDARIRYTLRGDNELILRIAFRRTPRAQWKQLAQYIAYADGLFGEISEVEAGDPAATDVPFQFEYRLAVPSFLDWSSKQAELRLPLATMGLPENVDPDDTTEPVELGSPLQITTRLKLALPAKYSARAPVAMALKRDYGDYRSQYKIENNVLTAERVLNLRMNQLPAARGRDYLSFVRAVRSDSAQRVHLESTLAGAPAIPETAKADELYQAGVAALGSNNYTGAIELLKRTVELEPKHKGAWNNLGLAHLALRQYKPAEDAFQKQIEVNPYDEYAYNNLGRAYWQERRYDEAAAAFRKQIEITPLDRWAYANLGMMFREQRKYGEAVPELERAITLTPNNPLLHVNLGQAYLNLGEPEKAIAAFDKAVEIAPSSTVFNNVAYELSLHRVQLDRAQQYAESAVAATAAELRNVALSRLTLQDVQRVSSLAAYWDTLGWVHFQKGDLDKAERYVRASWLLDFHGEVGDHLGQIYENRGRKQEAARQYALARAATRSEPETRKRLAALIGDDDARIIEAVQNAGDELPLLRTVRLGELLKERADAEFFLLVAPGPGGAAEVQEVRFISGSEKLRPFADALRKAKYNLEFPDDTPTKLVRRGFLSCGIEKTGCTMILNPADTVVSIN